MFTALLFLATCFVAYANGANDNFKGVASLFGSRTCGYRTAIAWATLTTVAGSLAAVFFAQTLLKKFSGKGLVPDALTASPEFVLAVALGAGATVLLATALGFPISTTHGLTGALVGAGLLAAGSQMNFAALGSGFVLPLLLSPLLALAVGGGVYLLGRSARLRLGVTKETCICAGVEAGGTPALASVAHAPGAGRLPPLPSGVFAAPALPSISVAVAAPAICRQRYAGRVLGVNAGRLLDTLHFLSAGAVSFARGLNDTPKIAALLLVAGALGWPARPLALPDGRDATPGVPFGLIAVAGAMAVGGLLNARKVADTMSHEITGMNPGQGFAANLSTALLVATASVNGLPVSTTHLCVGSLLGMGIVTRQANWKPVAGVLAAWVVTLPVAALLAALTYQVIR